MKYNRLGHTDLQISLLGLGGIPVQRNSASEVTEIIAAAEASGINFIDTARGYTVSEELIGQGLLKRRHKFVLASKSMQRTKEGIINDVKISLKNLQTEYLDLYQLHNIRTDDEWHQINQADGALAGLLQAKQEGLIRHIGITSHSADMMERALNSGLFATMMFPYNVVESHNHHLFATAQQNNIGTLAMKPLAGGFINDIRQGLGYLASDQNVDCILVGMASPQEITANSAAIAKGALSAEEKQNIETWAQEAGQNFCRRCGYCLPCPQGIDIPAVFLLEGYYDRYELQDWAKERYRAMSVPASECQACGQCMEKCPYNLQIPDKLSRAAVKLC